MSPGEQPPLDAETIARLRFRIRLGQALQRPTVAIWGVALWLALVGALIVGADLWGGRDLADRVLLQGALMPARVRQGEWWRLLTGPFLHQRLPHLGLNLAALVLIGRYVERGFGVAGLLVIYLGTSLTGAAGSIIAGHQVSIGASGAVFGMAGALVSLGIRLWPRLDRVLRQGLVGVPIVLVIGLFILGMSHEDGAGGLDVAAHFGGVLGGLTLGFALHLELRDVEGRPLSAAVSPWLVRGHAVLSSVLCVTAVASVAEVVVRSAAVPSVAVPTVQTLQIEDQAIVTPRSYAAGVWRMGATLSGAQRCEGGLVDPAWTLQTHRVVCYALPLAGVLLLGRADQLLTLDAGDRRAMARAWRERRFVWRQPQVLIAPAGGDLLYVVYGHPAMLATYAGALRRLLPDSTGRSLPAALARRRDQSPAQPPAGLPERVTNDQATEGR